MTDPQVPDAQLARQFVQMAERARDAGRFDEARVCFRRAMALQPEYSARYCFLIAQVSRFSEPDDDLRHMEALHAKSAADSDDRMLLAFALGRAFDQLGDFDRAFDYLDEGNRIAGARHPFVAGSVAVEPLTSVFDTAFRDRMTGTRPDGPLPILIAGLPRSGSTLVEQILASHSTVSGGGELGSLRRLSFAAAERLGGAFPEAFRAAGPPDLDRVGREYVRELAGLAGGRACVTDKSLGAIPFIGVIATALPDLRIVHCRRDFRDQGLSCYQHFFGPQQRFSYDLRNIAAYFRSRETLIQHWRQLFPGRILTLQYEALVADPGTQIRALLDFCGLPFEPACLAFHETERAVRTFSLTQVREPVYTSSVGRWKNYERQLEPLIEALGDLA